MKKLNNGFAGYYIWNLVMLTEWATRDDDLNRKTGNETMLDTILGLEHDHVVYLFS